MKSYNKLLQVTQYSKSYRFSPVLMIKPNLSLIIIFLKYDLMKTEVLAIMQELLVEFL